MGKMLVMMTIKIGKVVWLVIMMGFIGYVVIGSDHGDHFG